MQKLWCLYVDDIPGDARHDYKHKVAKYITSLKIFRLGLFHFLQRITSSWKGSNPITMAMAMQRLADCFTTVNNQDVRRLKDYNRSKGTETPATRSYLREHCRVHQLPVAKQLHAADQVCSQFIALIIFELTCHPLR